MLTNDEIKLIKAYQGNVPVLLQMWAMQVLKPCYKEANDGNMIAYNELISSIMTMKSHCSFILNTLAMPVPFAYYHVCVLLMYFNYTVLSIILVAQESIWTVLFLSMSILIISGMREIATAMSDPFGDDQGDLPTEKFVRDVRAQGSILGTVDARPPLDGYKPVLMVPEIMPQELPPPSFLDGIGNAVVGVFNPPPPPPPSNGTYNKKVKEELL